MTTSHTAAPAGHHLENEGMTGGALSSWRSIISGAGCLVVLVIAVITVGLWHLTQGTSGIGASELLRAFRGEDVSINGVPVKDIFTGSRLPRLCAGILVGFALGVAESLLQSITRNQLASPDTLAVTAGAYFSLTMVAAFGLAVPLWASSGVAFLGGILAAVLVLGLTGRAGETSTTRLILAGSAIAMALDAGSAMLLILFRENTTGLFAWGSGSLTQLNLDASTRAAPLIIGVLLLALLLSRRLDVLGLGEDTASSLGVPVRSTRIMAVLFAVLLTSTSVTLAGPIAFIGLGAPVLTRLIAHRIQALRRHGLLVPATGLIGALLILLADATLRTILGAEGAASVPTGIPTALIGGVIIVILALRMRDSGTARAAAPARSALRTRTRFTTVLVLTSAALLAAMLVGLLAGSLWLRTGDIILWIQHAAPDLISRALDERAPRIGAAVLAGAALALAGTAVQGTVRNPLAEPGLLGITAGAGLGAVIVVTTGIGGGGRPALITMAVLMGLATFALITLLASRGGSTTGPLRPDRDRVRIRAERGEYLPPPTLRPMENTEDPHLAVGHHIRPIVTGHPARHGGPRPRSTPALGYTPSPRSAGNRRRHPTHPRSTTTSPTPWRPGSGSTTGGRVRRRGRHRRVRRTHRTAPGPQSRRRTPQPGHPRRDAPREPPGPHRRHLGANTHRTVSTTRRSDDRPDRRTVLRVATEPCTQLATTPYSYPPDIDFDFAEKHHRRSPPEVRRGC